MVRLDKLLARGSEKLHNLHLWTFTTHLPSGWEVLKTLMAEAQSPVPNSALILLLAGGWTRDLSLVPQQ